MNKEAQSAFFSTSPLCSLNTDDLNLTRCSICMRAWVFQVFDFITLASQVLISNECKIDFKVIFTQRYLNLLLLAFACNYLTLHMYVLMCILQIKEWCSSYFCGNFSAIEVLFYEIDVWLIVWIHWVLLFEQVVRNREGFKKIIGLHSSDMRKNW